MPPEVFLNGRFVGRDDASVSAFDAGLQHGVGLFETMSARLGPVTSGGSPRPSVFRLLEHMDRLIGSASALGVSESLQREPLASAVEQTVERAGLAHARVRLTITGGDLNLLGGGDGAATRRSDGGGHDPTLLIVAQRATAYPPELFDRGARVAIADTKANPFNPAEGHKTVGYWWRLRELQRAASRGLDEALVFQISNHLAGGCVSNAFIVKDGVVQTPIARGEEGREHEATRGRDGHDAHKGSGAKGVAMPSPVLPGVTRGFVLEAAGRAGIEVSRRMISIDDVLDADEVFVTNSSFGVLPVTAVEAKSIGDGEVGPITASVRDAWRSASGAGG